MGQVCFTAISSNRACHYGLHCSQFSVPDHFLCVRFPKVRWLGTGARSLPPFSTVPGQLSPVGWWRWKGGGGRFWETDSKGPGPPELPGSARLSWSNEHHTSSSRCTISPICSFTKVNVSGQLVHVAPKRPVAVGLGSIFRSSCSFSVRVRSTTSPSSMTSIKNLGSNLMSTFASVGIVQGHVCQQYICPAQ